MITCMLGEHASVTAPVMMRLAQRRVLVTAGASGIGRAIATRLHAEGALVAAADVDSAALAALSEELPGVLTMTADVSSEEQVKDMAATIQQEFGGLDGMVNNAGVAGQSGTIDQLDLDKWQQCFSVNVEGVFLCVKHCLPLLRAPKPPHQPVGGSMVNISSTGGGLLGFPYRAAYATSKAALHGLTDTLAMELGREQIRVNQIMPGSIAGPRLDRVLAMTAEGSGRTVEQVQASWEAQCMMRKFQGPEDVAAAAAFLLSDDARFITSQRICVDGGTTTLDNLEDYAPLQALDL